MYKINTFSSTFCLKGTALVFANFWTTNRFGRRMCSGITDRQTGKQRDGRTDIQRLTIVYGIYAILIVLVVVVVMVLLVVVLAVVVVQFFMNYVLTQRSSGRFQTEHKLQRDCNNKSKQEKSQDKKNCNSIKR